MLHLFLRYDDIQRKNERKEEGKEGVGKEEGEGRKEKEITKSYSTPNPTILISGSI